MHTSHTTPHHDTAASPEPPLGLLYFIIKLSIGIQGSPELSSVGRAVGCSKSTKSDRSMVRIRQLGAPFCFFLFSGAETAQFFISARGTSESAQCTYAAAAHGAGVGRGGGGGCCSAHSESCGALRKVRGGHCASQPPLRRVDA